jgi:hypothetical protein
MTQLRINMTPAGTGDTTPPSISIIFAQKVGSTGWTLTITTDEGDGALYYLVTQGTATKPQVLAGAAQPVTQSGEQIISGSGLSPSSTYRVYVLHQDAAGNDSPVLVSNPFTTDELGSGSGSVAIQIMGRSDLEVAPEAVWFRADVTDSSVTATNAIGSYDESFHKLTYIWDFGDPGAASDKLTNVPVAHNDLNKAYGKHAAHVYASPGIYTVTCTVYAENRTLIGSDMQQVIVGDPDTLFTGNRTILLDPAGAGRQRRLSGVAGCHDGQSGAKRGDEHRRGLSGPGKARHHHDHVGSVFHHQPGYHEPLCRHLWQWRAPGHEHELGHPDAQQRVQRRCGVHRPRLLRAL